MYHQVARVRANVRVVVGIHDAHKHALRGRRDAKDPHTLYAG